MKKLNNRGFAISGILYGILILFLMILVSVLKLMVVKVGNLTDQQEVVRQNVEATKKVDSVTMEGDYFKTPARGKYHIKVQTTSGSYKDCSAFYLPKSIIVIAHNNQLTYLEPKNGKVDLSKDTYYPLSCNSKKVIKVLSAGYDKFLDQS